MTEKDAIRSDAEDHRWVAYGYDSSPIHLGEPIPMKCLKCNLPHPGLEKAAAWARPYVCPCGSSSFVGTVTFRG